MNTCFKKLFYGALFALSCGMAQASQFILTLEPNGDLENCLSQIHGIQEYEVISGEDADQLMVRIEVEDVAAYEIVAELEKLEGVQMVELDTELTVDPIISVGPDEENIGIQAVGSWGIDRIDGALDGTFKRSTYDGSGTTIYVIDTGVYGAHNDFTGRVERGIDIINPKAGGNADCNGHGTHVASTAAGEVYGVARKAQIYPIKVLTCSGTGTISDVIKGINYAADHKRSGPKVISMSLGGGLSRSLNNAVTYAKSKGVFVVVAAGNSNADACKSSPASSSDALTVGSTDPRDARSSFSNYGKCVDIFAPGSSIKAASNVGKSSTRVLSGTSMATPHVSGVLATLLQENPKLSVQKGYDMLLSWTEKDVVANPGGGSPNLFLKNVSPTPRPTPLPTMRPTKRGETRRPTVAPSPTPTTISPTEAPTQLQCFRLDSCDCKWTPACVFVKGAGCRSKGWCGTKKQRICRSMSWCKWEKKSCRPTSSAKSVHI